MHKCHQKGHIAKVCRATGQQGASMYTTGSYKKTQWVQVDLEDTSDSETELPVLKVATSRQHPIRIKLKVNGKPLVMELDTGAAVSIISGCIHHVPEFSNNCVAYIHW